MKKILLTSSLSFLLVVISVLLLSSCDNYKEILNFKDDSTVKKYDLRIVVSIQPDNTSWRNSVLNCAWRAREELMRDNTGVEVDLILARDEHDQADQLNTLLKKGRIDALVIMADKPENVANYCRNFRRKSTMVIAVHNNIVFPQCPNVLVTGDNSKIGRDGALAIVEALGGGDARGTILAFTDFSNPAIRDRYASFREVITQYMKLKVVEINYTDLEKTPFDAMVTYCKKNEPFDAVWTGWDSILEDVIRACNSTEQTENIRAFVGGNGTKNINRMLLDENSKVPINMTYPPTMMYDAIMLAFERLTATDRSELSIASPEFIIIPSEVITKDNAKNFMNSPDAF